MSLLSRGTSLGVAFALALLALGPTAVWAQSGTATLGGRVTDPQGSVVPGATVTIVNVATSASRFTVTNESGLYQLTALPPGTYNMTVELTGFRTARLEKLELRVDTQSRVDVPLEVGQLAETVTVQGRSFTARSGRRPAPGASRTSR